MLMRTPVGVRRVATSVRPRGGTPPWLVTSTSTSHTAAPAERRSSSVVLWAAHGISPPTIAISSCPFSWDEREDAGGITRVTKTPPEQWEAFKLGAGVGFEPTTFRL